VGKGGPAQGRIKICVQAGGMIPLLIGLGVLLDYRLLTKDLLKQRAHNREQESQPAEHSQAQ
jgi:hypothetical protein